MTITLNFEGKENHKHKGKNLASTIICNVFVYIWVGMYCVCVYVVYVWLQPHIYKNTPINTYSCSKIVLLYAVFIKCAI